MPKGIVKYHRLRNMPGMLSNTDGDSGGGTPPPAPAPADGAGAGKPGETPEQTIAGLREALAKANNEAKDHRQKAKDRDALQKELDDLRAAGETGDDKARRDAERALQKARDEAAAAARAEVTVERVLDKIEVAAAGKFTDISDARLHLEKRADEFHKDGQIDTAAIAAAVDKLLTDKPHLAATTKTPVPAPGRVGIGTGGSSASDAGVTPGLGRLQNAYAQSPHQSK